MPALPTLKISEIFWSAQGEGARVGTPSIFIRLAGCTLRCPYCDTRTAWDKGKRLTINPIMKRVANLASSYPASQVVISGGEPLEQDLRPLVAALKKKRFFVAAETNGLHYQKLAFDWWAVSPKAEASFRIQEKLLPLISEIKVLVAPGLTVAVVRRLRRKVPGVPLWLQPQAFDKSRFRRTWRLYQECQKAGLKNVRLGFQLHRVFGVR